MPPPAPQSAAEGASLARYGVRAVERCIETQGLMAKPCTPHPIAQRVQLFKIKTANANAFLLDGHTARFLSTERKWGVWCCGAHAAFPPLPETGSDISAPFGAEKGGTFDVFHRT